MSLGIAPVDDDLLGQVDVTDPWLHSDGDPHAVFAWLRRHRPVDRRLRPDGRAYWVVTRHADISAVFRDSTLFSSEYGLVVEEIRDGGKDPSANRVLEMCGPARHRQLRSRMAPPYTRRSSAALEGLVREQTRSFLDAAVDAGTFDFAADVADPLAAALTFGLLGLPREDWAMVREVQGRAEDKHGIGIEAAAEAHHELLRYFLRLVREAGRVDDGHVRLLLAGDADHEPLRPEEVALNALALLEAGYGTLRHAATAAMHALLEHPGEYARARADTSLVPTLAEEVVRWSAPVIHLARVATRDVELGGASIQAGDIVSVWLPSANRDEEVFEQPDRFDAGRSPNSHLGYAVGPHVCLGVHLSRVQLRVLLEELTGRVPVIERTGPPRRVPSTAVAGFRSLPVRIAR